ncbi:MAG TPA: DUF1570 domain-containing protein [Kofleriaceae bacterium]|jgi:hypothetical protein
MWTDASPDRGRELLQQMEHFRSIIYGVAFPDLPPGGVTLVIALRDHRESAAFTPLYHPAYAMHGGPLLQPTMVLPADAYGDETLVAHELTHAISYNAVHEQPRWFAEGIAMYFQSIDLDAKHATVDVGKPPPDVGELRSHPLEPITAMFACKEMSCTDDHIFYSTAWTMYAWLRNEHPKELAHLEELFEDEPADRAWREVFPDHAIETFALELRAWLTSGGLKIWTFKIALKTWPVTQRTLSDADVHAARALLDLEQHRDRVDAEVAAALALEPNQVVARTIDYTLHHDRTTVPIARAVVAAHPDQWLAWRMLAETLHSGAEAHDAHVKMCDLVLQNPALSAYRRCAKERSASQPGP